MITSVKSRTWTEARYLHQKDVSQLYEIICHLFYLDCLCRLLFLSSITVETFTARAYEYHGGCLIRNMNCLPFASTPVFFVFFCFFGRSLCCSSFYLLFCLDLLCVLCPMFLCFWIAHSYLPLGFLWIAHSYLPLGFLQRLFNNYHGLSYFDPILLYEDFTAGC
jgi:hypothetical protein